MDENSLLARAYLEKGENEGPGGKNMLDIFALGASPPNIYYLFIWWKHVSSTLLANLIYTVECYQL